MKRSPSVVVKLVDTQANSSLERKNIRLTGIPYERFFIQSKWGKYKDIDDYYIIYERENESRINLGNKYHRISVLHGLKGTRNFRSDDTDFTIRSKNKCKKLNE